jgi:hypothetical protein
MSTFVKPSLDHILDLLGFASIFDYDTIIQEKDLEKIPDELIVSLIQEYKLSNIEHSSEYSIERKREIINRVLEFKYGTIIDTLTSFDQLGNGMRLEKMPL